MRKIKRLILIKQKKVETDEIPILEERLVFVGKRPLEVPVFSEDRSKPFIQVRVGGQFAYNAYYLNDFNFNWALGFDSNGRVILVPLKKEIDC